MHDQAGIWTSPLRIRGRDALWLAPFAAAAAVSLRYDADAMQGLGSSPSRERVSRDFSQIGSPYTVFGVAGASYLIGSLSHNEKMRETGVLGAEAILDTAVVVTVIKLATNRERPEEGMGTGGFWPEGTRGYPHTSFPSMHAAGTWALIHVIAKETPGHPILHIGLYTLAAGISATRVTARKHFPSDILVGGTFGYLIGGYVYRHHSASNTDTRSSFTLFPVVNSTTRSYGMGVAFDPAMLSSARLWRFHQGEN